METTLFDPTLEDLEGVDSNNPLEKIESQVYADIDTAEMGVTIDKINTEISNIISKFAPNIRSAFLASLLAISINAAIIQNAFAKSPNSIGAPTEQNVKSESAQEVTTEPISFDNIENYFLLPTIDNLDFDLVNSAEIENLTSEDKIVLASAGYSLPASFRADSYLESQSGTINIISGKQLGPNAYSYTAVGPAHGFHEMMAELDSANMMRIGLKDNGYWPAAISFGPEYETKGLDTNESDEAKIDFLTNAPIKLPLQRNGAYITRAELSQNPEILSQVPVYVTGFPSKIDDEGFTENENTKRVIVKGWVDEIFFKEDGQISSIMLEFPEGLDDAMLNLGGMSGGKVSIVYEGVEFNIGTYRGHEFIKETGKYIRSIVSPHENAYAESKLKSYAVPTGDFFEENIPTVETIKLALLKSLNTDLFRFGTTVALINTVHTLAPESVQLVENGNFTFTRNNNGVEELYIVDIVNLTVEKL